METLVEILVRFVVTAMLLCLVVAVGWFGSLIWPIPWPLALIIWIMDSILVSITIVMSIAA